MLSKFGSMRVFSEFMKSYKVQKWFHIPKKNLHNNKAKVYEIKEKSFVDCQLILVLTSLTRELRNLN